MTRWELRPLEAVGKICFGMKREDVHKLFEEKCKEFKKSKFSKNTTDDYINFHVFYTADDRVEAVEIFENLEIVLGNDVIFPIKTTEIEKLFPGIKKDENGFIDIEKSIGYEADSNMTQSILVANKGYYE